MVLILGSTRRVSLGGGPAPAPVFRTFARSGRRWAVIGNRLHLVSGDVQSAGIASMHLHSDSHDAFELVDQ